MAGSGHAGRGRPRRRPLVHRDCGRGVFELALSRASEQLGQTFVEAAINDIRDQHRALVGSVLQSGRKVDAIAKDVVFLEHHVTKVNAHPQLERATRRDLALQIKRTARGIRYRVKLNKPSVAHALDDVTAMVADQRFQHLPAQLAQLRERFVFVLFDLAGIVHNIGCKHRGQSSVWCHAHHVMQIPVFGKHSSA